VSGARRSFTPSVIEPSFGIGRIIYCLLEHCYYTREGDEKRAVFGLEPLIAPIKVCRPLPKADVLTDLILDSDCPPRTMGMLTCTRAVLHE